MGMDHLASDWSDEASESYKTSQSDKDAAVIVVIPTEVQGPKI